MEKFLKVGKINSFPILNSFNGNALLVFAANHNNYTMNVSEVSGSDALKVSSSMPVAMPGEELIIDGQEITVKIESDNIDAYNGGFREWSIKAKYGVRGDKGISGPIGEDGDQGPSAFEVNNITEGANTLKIINNLTSNDNNSLLSALQGNMINTFIKKHDEVLISTDNYNQLSSKVTNRVYYTIDESHRYTGKKYTLSGTIEWDAPVDNSNYDISIDVNGNLSIDKNAGNVEDHTVVLKKDSAEVSGNTLIIKKSKSIVSNVEDSTIEFNNVSVNNHEIVLKTGNATIENGILILKR